MSDADLNPYRSPAPLAEETSRYLGLNSTRLTYRECWWLSANALVFVVLAIFKTLRIRLPLVLAYIPEQVELTTNQLSTSTQGNLADFSQLAAALGYESQIILGFPLLGLGEVSTAVFHAPGSQALLCVDFVRLETHHIAKQRAAFSTMLVDGTHLMTSQARPEMEHPATTRAEFHPRLDLPALLERHAERVRQQSLAVEPLLNRDDCEALARWLDRTHIDYLRERGVLEPISAADFQRLSATMSIPVQPRLPTWLTWLDFLTWTLGLLIAWLSLFGEPLMPGTFLTRFVISLTALAAIVAVTTIKQVVRRQMTKRSNDQ